MVRPTSGVSGPDVSVLDSQPKLVRSDASVFLDKSQTFASKGHGIGENIAPDLGCGSNVWQGRSKGFNGEISTVIRGLYSGPELIPMHLAGAWNTTVVLGNMNMADMVLDTIEGAGLRFFLDMAMERVVHHFA